jgi:hypothetical protein
MPNDWPLRLLAFPSVFMWRLVELLQINGVWRASVTSFPFRSVTVSKLEMQLDVTGDLK